MGATVPPPASPTSVPSDGQMTMAPLASVPLPAGEAVLFEAGGKHIMLNDLAAPLVEGQTFVAHLLAAHSRDEGGHGAGDPEPAGVNDQPGVNEPAGVNDQAASAA